MLAKQHFHFSGWSIEINHLFRNKNKYNQNSMILISVNPIKAGGSKSLYRLGGVPPPIPRKRP